MDPLRDFHLHQRKEVVAMKPVAIIIIFISWLSLVGAFIAPPGTIDAYCPLLCVLIQIAWTIIYVSTLLQSQKGVYVARAMILALFVGSCVVVVARFKS